MEQGPGPEGARKVCPKRKRDEQEANDSDGCESVSSDGSDSMGSLREFIIEDPESGSDADSEHSECRSDDEMDEDSACPKWIDPTNIVSGKRTRRAVTRYEDPAYKTLMMEDCSDLSGSSNPASEACSDTSFNPSPGSASSNSSSGGESDIESVK